MQIMAEIKIRTEEILLQCRYAGVISLSGPVYNQQRGDCDVQKTSRLRMQEWLFYYMGVKSFSASCLCDHWSDTCLPVSALFCTFTAHFYIVLSATVGKHYLHLQILWSKKPPPSWGREVSNAGIWHLFWETCNRMTTKSHHMSSPSN